MKQLGRMWSIFLLLLTCCVALLAAAPVAAAATSAPRGPAVTPVNARPSPMALASTGLDITVPVIIGITLLVLGMGIVAWAFLRTSSTDQRH